MTTEFAIDVSRLSKEYAHADGRTFWALKDLSFQVKKGEMLGIIGANGSGKSTLLKILSGIAKPTSGTATIKGSFSSVLEIGSGFHPDLSGLDNIRLKAELLGQRKQLTAKLTDEIIAFSGLQEFIDEPVKNYSNGMFIRLAFSIYSHLRHDVLLIDEVLSAGDFEFQNRIKDSGFLRNASGIMVSHELEAVAEFCDRIMVLDKGVIAEVSDAKTAITNYRISKYRDLEMKLLNRRPFEVNRVVDGHIYIKTISALSCESDGQLIGSRELRFCVELSNIGINERQIILVPFLRTLGQNVDLHADSPSIWIDGKPLTIAAGAAHRLEFSYPSNFFGKGHYSIGLLVSQPERLLERMESLAFFNVSGDAWENGRLWNNLFAQNRTHLKWSIQNV